MTYIIAPVPTFDRFAVVDLTTRAVIIPEATLEYCEAARDRLIARSAALRETFADARDFAILDLSPNALGGARVKADGTTYAVDFGLPGGSRENRPTDIVLASIADRT